MYRSMRRKGIVIAAVVLLTVVLAIVGCSSKPDTSSPEALLESIFTSPRDDKSSGMTNYQINGSEATIEYNYFPVGISPFDEELGVHLSSKIKDLFEQDYFDKITIIAKGPFDDGYGNYNWVPLISFEFTREIYDKINWDNFVSQNLVKISQNVKFY
ncbi:MAG: hypothetical protein GXW90_00515 [Tepidanaerobacter acetatoxydans]|uniref:hypothetical protein n=1 Tax=Tepidanaerobacter acetatoxydans TaxID=499229 RepID=UPI0026F1FC56|nr:hypothetical protein [Tepidanaerobacter acetatoxydans]NLU09429.1 hypothetical protein [Tepidanaerobacter acetatoxydans]